MNQNEKSVGEFVGTAFISYIATNADDLIILMNLFTEATISNSSLKVRHVFIGQYFGFFLILLGVSLIGYGISYVVRVQMLGFLRFLPIILGLKGLIEIIIEIIIEISKKSQLNLNDIIPDDNSSTIESEAIRRRNDIDGKMIFEYRTRQVEETVIHSPPTIRLKQKILRIFSYCFNIQTLKTASITVANSGDNVAIYTPLFAQASRWQIRGYIGIFLFMVFVWLIFSY
jgi:cadmium resistance protein CadD (predicted permease)